MIAIKDSKTIGFFGFTVYDSETGDPVEAGDLLSNKAQMAWFAIEDTGALVILYVDSWHDFGRMNLPHENKYLIQFGSGEYMRW